MTPEQTLRIMVDLSLPMALGDEQREKVKKYMIDIVNQAVAEERENARKAVAVVMRSMTMPHKGEKLPTEEEFVAALDKILADVK